MLGRLPLAQILLFTSCVALFQGCAAKPAVVTAEPQRDAAAVAQPQRDSAAAAQPPVESFRPSAPNEIVSERVKTDRTRAVGDMLRTDLVTTVEQGPLGILRVGVGQKFHSHPAREYYFTQLAFAYHGWRAEGHPIIVELWEGGRKIGEYTDRAFLIGPRFTTPRDCPEAATTGQCSLAESGRGETPPSEIAGGVAPPQASPGGGPAPAAARARPAANPRESGVHFGLGLGGGAMDFACRGCTVTSETGFSGFLSVAGSVGEKTLLGIEATGWTGDQLGTTAQVYSLMAQATEYRSTTSGLFLGAGLGLVGYHQDTDSGVRSAKGLGFSGRLGYELGTGGIVLVPYVGIVRTFGGADMKLDGRDEGLNVAISNVHFGLSIAAH
jgi:hypothetical protein